MSEKELAKQILNRAGQCVMTSPTSALFSGNISDKKRKHSPLKVAKNAVVVVTTKIGKKAMLDVMSKYVDRIIKLKYVK